jgi:hypothetical protein
MARDVLEQRSAACCARSSYGAPPHGGMAPASTASSCCSAARRTCARWSLFPMNQRAEDLLMGAPVGRRRRSSCASCTSGSTCIPRPGKPGKLEIQATKPLANQRDLALAYSPGVAAACEEIAAIRRAAAS